MLSLFGFSRSAPAPTDIYQKHLPVMLYNFLQRKGLLDQNSHEFYSPGPPSSNMTFSIKLEPAVNEFPEMLTLTLKTHPVVTTVNFSFSYKIYFLFGIIDENGTDFLAPGNIKSTPLDGLSDEQCARETLGYVNKLMETIDSITPLEQVLRLAR